MYTVKIGKSLYKICTESVQNLYKICPPTIAGRGVKKLRILENSQIDNVPDQHGN